MGRPAEQGHAGDVPVVLAGLVGAAQDDIVDVLWRETASVNQRTDNGGG